MPVAGTGENSAVRLNLMISNIFDTTMTRQALDSNQRNENARKARNRRKVKIHFSDRCDCDISDNRQANREELEEERELKEREEKATMER